MKLFINGILIICCLFFVHCSKPAHPLVTKIVDTDNSTLAKMTFFELNILKNSIFSTIGYKYADDRPWLYHYFYTKHGPAKNASDWNMSEYTFTKPDSGIEFKLNDTMKKAIANVRVALLKKIRSYQDINQIDTVINREVLKHKHGIFGREVKYLDAFKKSIRREVHGYHRIVSIIDNNSDFDACELLGVYVGSAVLLKNVIEAKHGKEFRGVIGWEISQIAGITPKKDEYDFKKLPVKVKARIIRLQDVIRKMKASGIGDIPADLKKQSLSVEEKIYEDPKEETYDEMYENEEERSEEGYSAAC